MALLTDSDKSRWDAFVASSDFASCYHQVGWKEVIEKSFGHQTYYLMSENGLNGIDGILPLVHLKSLIFGNFLVSLPYFNYGGVCVSNQESVNKLLGEAKFLATEVGAEYIEFRHVEHLYEDLPVKKNKVTMTLILPEDAELLLKSEKWMKLKTFMLFFLRI